MVIHPKAEPLVHEGRNRALAVATGDQFKYVTLGAVMTVLLRRGLASITDDKEFIMEICRSDMPIGRPDSNSFTPVKPKVTVGTPEQEARWEREAAELKAWKDSIPDKGSSGL